MTKSPSNEKDVFHPENYAKWTPVQLAEYLKVKCDLGKYYEMILQHDVSGAVAPQLKEDDLKEMGIDSIGDRKRFVAAIEELSVKARKLQREEVLWEGQEVLWYSCWDACMGTCCGCCPEDPSTYKLTNTHLTLKTVLPNRFLCLRCCCGHEYEIDNIDLTYVTSVDIKGEAPPCCQMILCCGKGRDHITIQTSSEGNKSIIIRRGEGEVVSRKIMNQAEEMQRMERD